MMRQTFLIALVVCLCLWLNRAGAEELDIKNCRILTGFYMLWKKSFFGREPNREEAAAWITSDSLQQYLFVLWEITPEREKNTWRGTRPGNVVAIAHTHPEKVDQKPSTADAALAGQLSLPIYTISRKGIWMVTPDGALIQEAERQWYDAVDSCK